MKARPRVLAFVLLSSSVFGITGCSSGKCNEAKTEEKRLSKKMESLSKKYVNSEQELKDFLTNYCANLEISDETLLDVTGKEIWCDDWKRTGNTPPIGGAPLREITQRLDDLKHSFENAQNRWALTVTTYRDCFEASKVIDATEILND